MKIRKNQKNLTATEWDDFICAFQNLKQGLLKGVEKPSLDDFADEHAAAFKEKNHHWQVHSHDPFTPGHWGLKFLAWHRVFLQEFENRLRKEVPGVTIPYWNAFKDSFPEALRKISDNEGEQVHFEVSELPNFQEPDFNQFQFDLEMGYHNKVHRDLGGTVGRRHSPRDATFWLHHAFVDRQWGHWFVRHDGAPPANLDELILGQDIVKGKRVRDVLHTSQLDYVYGNGIYHTIAKSGSDTFRITLEPGLILCAKISEDFYAKLLVHYTAPITATLTMQLFAYGKPGVKYGLFPSETSYANLLTGKLLHVTEDQAHVRFLKKTTATGASYIIEARNGTQLATFNAITDFTAQNGAGAVDYDMLYF